MDNFLDNVTHGRLHPSFPTAEGELGPCGMGASGSFHTGDPHTTNLYVGNLSPTVTEEVSIDSIYLCCCEVNSYDAMDGLVCCSFCARSLGDLGQ